MLLNKAMKLTATQRKEIDQAIADELFWSLAEYVRHACILLMRTVQKTGIYPVFLHDPVPLIASTSVKFPRGLLNEIDRFCEKFTIRDRSTFFRDAVDHFADWNNGEELATGQDIYVEKVKTNG